MGERRRGAFADRVALLESFGIPTAQAQAFTEATDEEMGRCILALYRSAAQPAMAEWGADAPAATARPGLVITATADRFTGGPEGSLRSAERLGAGVAVLEGLGHWWMLEGPEPGAAVLREFWASLDDGGPQST